MANDRSVFFRKVTVLTIPLVAYFVASVFQSQFWGGILSPVNAFAAAGILFYAFFRLRDHKLSRISLLDSIACLSWGIADIIWAVQASGGADPAENPVLWVLYSLTNLFLILSYALFVIIQVSKWNSVQMITDVIATAMSSGAFLWIVFLNKDHTVLRQLIQMDFTSLASISMDVILASGIFMWYLAVRTRNIPRYLLDRKSVV